MIAIARVAQDWLGEALLELASVHPSDGAWTAPSGEVRLLEPPLRYSRLVKAGFNQLRQAAPDNPALTIRLFETFARMTSQLINEDHRKAVRLQVEALWEMASSAAMSRADHSDVEAAYESASGAGPPNNLVIADTAQITTASQTIRASAHSSRAK